MLRSLPKLLPAVFLFVGTLSVPAAGGGPAAVRTSTTASIKHVVIVMQENHSFDNVLGRLCVQYRRCDGATTGLVHDGTIIDLPAAKNIVPRAPHNHEAMLTAIDGGRMDGFDAMVAGEQNCAGPAYDCYQAYDPSQIPDLAALALNFVISDRTFQSDLAASWGSHLGLVAGTLDGFSGDNPCSPPRCPSVVPAAPGWGCDSHRDAPWRARPDDPLSYQPACVPDPELAMPNGGAYRQSDVAWTPTIMDRLDGAKLSWKLYAGTDKVPASAETSDFPENGYQWAICPTFADCLYTSQARNLALASQVIDDAATGSLPAVSIVTPTSADSQHNLYSMRMGDNWIGRVVQAIENGPDWSSTAVFITYDDCGCFYDHVAPPSGLGIRVPMVIVSPYAKRSFTDSTVASYASLLAFVEHNFKLRPLAKTDAEAYDFANSFNFSTLNASTVPMTVSPETPDDIRYLEEHPADPDDEDPT
jgi:phospholipase C